MKRRTHGFSLIELIMVIVIISVVSVVISRIMFNSFRMFRVSQDIADTDWQALLAIESIANDIHDIRSANDITTINPSTFAFVDVEGTATTYQLSGNLIQRGGVTLASNVSGLTFTYLDENGVVTATPTLVRYVRVSVTNTQNNLSQNFTSLIGTRGMS